MLRRVSKVYHCVLSGLKSYDKYFKQTVDFNSISQSQEVQMIQVVQVVVQEVQEVQVVQEVVDQNVHLIIT